ncbi:MAG: M3 family metallopeptidase [Thermomicrobiales bacterium]
MSDSGWVAQWDLALIYPSVSSSEFDRDLNLFTNGINCAKDLAESIARARQLDDSEQDVVRLLDELFDLLDESTARGWTLDAYVAASLDVSPHDQRLIQTEASLSQALAELDATRRATIAVLAGPDQDSLVQGSRWGREHSRYVSRAVEASSKTLSPDQERAVDDLRMFGVHAWARLHRELVASAVTILCMDEGPQTVTLAELNRLKASVKREERKAAYDAECTIWSQLSVPLVQSLNPIKGEAAYLSRKRGWSSILDESLWRLGLDAELLTELVSTVESALPMFHRFLRAKAQFAGTSSLAWYDLQAVAESPEPLDIDAAAAIVTAAFHQFSSEMGDLAERALREGWIDAAPRPNKPTGGLCYWLGQGESRIRISFGNDIDGLRMLAHELGHAYHNVVLADAGTSALEIEGAPTPLMECVSKFCEQLAYGEMSRLAATSDRDLLAMLDAQLTATYRSVVESLVLFRFEEQFIAKREARVLSVAECNGLLLEARAGVSGGALDTSTPFPWSWASVPHLYLVDAPFYNLPYLVAQLLGISLYGRFQRDPDAFRQTFVEAVTRVGALSVKEFTGLFDSGESLASFWRDGLSAIEADVDRYEALVRHRSR